MIVSDESRGPYGRQYCTSSVCLGADHVTSSVFFNRRPICPEAGLSVPRRACQTVQRLIEKSAPVVTSDVSAGMALPLVMTFDSSRSTYAVPFKDFSVEGTATEREGHLKQ